MSLTAENRANLEKLATYLEGLPERYRHFDMWTFLRERARGTRDEVLKYARENGGVARCGTVACAVGHGPAAGVLFPEDCFRRSVRTGQDFLDWDGYTELFLDRNSDEFTWAFGSCWKSSDNSHYGAAARIRYLLEHGSAPDGFRNPGRHYRKLYAPFRIDAKVSA